MKILIGDTKKTGLNQIKEVNTPEKNPKHCHRSLVRHYLLHLEEFSAKSR